jgi:CRISPR-associated endonuclease Cas2
MAVLLVTYDLNKEGKSKVDYNEFYKVRNTYPYARLSESSYALETNEQPAELYEKLKKLIDPNDHIYIITLKRPYFGFGPKAVNDWLEQRLTY